MKSWLDVRIACALLLICTLGAPLKAWAWSAHRLLMPSVLAESSSGGATPIALQARLPRSSPEMDRARFQELALRLGLNPGARIPSLEITQRSGSATGAELLTVAVDDPDAGLDQDLPNSTDPAQDRKFMGGSHGFSSQGFRHMFFGGWKLGAPLASFQIPARALGQAPDRAEILANEALASIRSGDLAWGLRLLGWALHYVQDLSQPFHAAQVPSLRMIPWMELLHWPLREGFENLIRRGTRTVGNYHLGYEGYVRYQLQRTDTSPYKPCLTGPRFTWRAVTPREIALEMSARSLARAREVGSALYAFAGPDLMQPEYDLAKKQGNLNEATLASDPRRMGARGRLDEVTCEALADAKDASLGLIAWVFASAAR